MNGKFKSGWFRVPSVLDKGCNISETDPEFIPAKIDIKEVIIVVPGEIIEEIFFYNNGYPEGDKFSLEWYEAEEHQKGKSNKIPDDTEGLPTHTFTPFAPFPGQGDQTGIAYFHIPHGSPYTVLYPVIYIHQPTLEGTKVSSVESEPILIRPRNPRFNFKTSQSSSIQRVLPSGQ